MDESDLEALTIRELRDYRDRVDDAIRNKIALQRRERERSTLGQTEPVLQSFDLEQESIKWTMRRKM